MAVTGGALVAAAGVVIFLKHWLAIAVGPLARTVAPPAVACVPWIVLRLSWVGSADTILVLLGEAVLFAVLFVSGLLAMDRLALYRVDPAIREMLGRWIPRRR
jgi:hypothetical protein